MAAVLDYSWTHPDPGAMKQAGVVGVMRYIGGSGGGHDLSPGERDALRGAGLDIGLVFETSGTRMNGGAAAGAADAHRANADADALGFPSGRPLYFANDQNACTQAHVDYMRAARDNSPRPVGPYGNTTLIDRCTNELGCRYGWKVSTWGGPTNNACLIQEANARPPFNGTDLNTATRDDWGQWGGQAAPPKRKRHHEEEAVVLGG